MASILFFIAAVISLFLISTLLLFLYFSPWLQFIPQSAIPCFLGKQKAPVECELGNKFGARVGDARGDEM
jgi:NADH:ubiquinone oxidoreductase subunit H